MFRGNDNYDQLVKIAKIMGTDDLFEYLKKYNLTLSHHYHGILGRYPRVPWSEFVNGENKHLVNPEALDLLDKMLVYDRGNRILPCEAMKHPYFAPVVEWHQKNPGVAN